MALASIFDFTNCSCARLTTTPGWLNGCACARPAASTDTASKAWFMSPPGMTLLVMRNSRPGGRKCRGDPDFRAGTTPTACGSYVNDALPGSDPDTQKTQ